YVDVTGDAMIGSLTMNAQNEVRFADTDSSNYVGFVSPAVVGADQIWVLPAADGSANQALITDGSGNLSWSTNAVGDILSITAGAGLTGGGTDGDVTIAIDNGVVSSMIADGTVALADLAANSVNSSKIVNGSVALADLAADSVNSSKIVDAS